MIVAILHLTIKGIRNLLSRIVWIVNGCHSKVSTYRSDTSAAIGRAIESTTSDGQTRITANHTCGQCSDVTLSGSEDVTVVTGLAVTTNHCGLFCWLADSCCDITHYVTILTTTIDSAIYGTIRDIDRCRSHVSACIEEDTLITHASAINITTVGVRLNLSRCARHANSTSSHRDGNSSLDIRHLATTIEVVQDMSARDGYRSCTSDVSCRSQPQAWSVWIVTRATGKHIAVERAAISCNWTSAFR